jgi:hypothetical protein
MNIWPVESDGAHASHSTRFRLTLLATAALGFSLQEKLTLYRYASTMMLLSSAKSGTSEERKRLRLSLQHRFVMSVSYEGPASSSVIRLTPLERRSVQRNCLQKSAFIGIAHHSRSFQFLCTSGASPLAPGCHLANEKTGLSRESGWDGDFK